MSLHHVFGTSAEDAAIAFLTEKGYVILTRNYRFLKAEIDIIAEYNSKIIFVEVKARSSAIIMEPHEAVDRAKIGRYVRTANHYIVENFRTEEAQFDIVSILRKDNAFEITHFPDAFESIDA